MSVAELLKSSVDDALYRPDWTKSSGREGDLLWLDKNENCDPVLNEVVMGLYRSVEGSSFYGYPDTSKLYMKLAVYLDVNASNILLSHGSDGVIRSMFEAFVAVGDKVLIPSPTFVMYEIYSKMYGAKLVSIDYSYSSDGPLLNCDQFMRAIQQHKPKLVCLANPDSPTGTVFSDDELTKIIQYCAKENILILIDEAYYPFCKITALPLINKYPNLVVSRTFAKAWGLAGLRIGYAIGDGVIISYLHKVRPMYEVNSVAVSVVEKMLDKVEEVYKSVNRLQEGMSYFLNEMNKMGFGVFRGAGNFSHVDFGSQSDYIFDRLKADVLYKKSFSHPSLVGYSRFSSATKEQMKRVVDLLI